MDLQVVVLSRQLGTYVVTAECEGYDPYTAGSNVTVTDDDTLTVEMTAETVTEGEGG